MDATQASLLFQVIAQRYEKQQAIILTSNKAFADWAGIFAGDAIMASAALDRLLHRATVLNIRGTSYRMKARQRAGTPDTQATGTQTQESDEPQPQEQTRPSRNKARSPTESREVNA